MKRIFSNSDNSAVSPIIGVILMVGLTIVLAGLVHAHMVHLGQEKMNTAPPQAAFTVDTDKCAWGDKYRMTHSIGEKIPADSLYLQSPDVTLSGSWENPSGYETYLVDDGFVQAGDSAAFCIKNGGDITIHLVWRADTSDQTVVVNRWDEN